MTKPKQYNRILAIAPASRGFGYALLEGERLVLWGVRSVTEDKNDKCVAKVEDLIIRYQPEVMVLEDTAATGSRRYPVCILETGWRATKARSRR